MVSGRSGDVLGQLGKHVRFPAHETDSSGPVQVSGSAGDQDAFDSALEGCGILVTGTHPASTGQVSSGSGNQDVIPGSPGEGAGTASQPCGPPASRLAAIITKYVGQGYPLRVAELLAQPQRDSTT